MLSCTHIILTFGLSVCAHVVLSEVYYPLIKLVRGLAVTMSVYCSGAVACAFWDGRMSNAIVARLKWIKTATGGIFATFAPRLHEHPRRLLKLDGVLRTALLPACIKAIKDRLSCPGRQPRPVIGLLVRCSECPLATMCSGQRRLKPAHDFGPATYWSGTRSSALSRPRGAASSRCQSLRRWARGRQGPSAGTAGSASVTVVYLPRQSPLGPGTRARLLH